MMSGRNSTDQQNSATKLCAIPLPVFQAGMAGLASPDLVAAVSNAGGLGHLGALRLPPKELRRQIEIVRTLTDKPFGINLVPQYGGPEMFERLLSIAIDARPRAISLFYGNFSTVIPRIRDAGIVAMVQVGSLAEARKALLDGADILIAQGIETGGHIRGHVGLMALLPAIVDIAKNCPVLAAGAIHDERAVRAVRALGAADTDAPRFRTGYSYGWKWGTPHRAIPGRGGLNLMRFMGGGIRPNDDGALADKLSLYAGQGVGQTQDILPASDIVARLAAGFDD